MTRIVAWIASAAAFVSPALAQSVTLTPVADATLYQSDLGDAANGSRDYFFVGTTVRENNIRRAVLRFDLASVPPTAEITSARLEVYASRVQAGPRLVVLREVTAPWTEGPSNPFGDEGIGDPPIAGDCTWLHRSFPSMLWSSPGGDFGGSILSSQSVNAVGAYAFESTPQFVALVQAWAGDPGLNRGLMAQGDESTNGTAKRFDSRSNPVLANRPRLIVGYRCPADFNHDSFINGDDYDAFASSFEAGEPNADINADSFVNGDDFDRFAESFEAGC